MSKLWKLKKRAKCIHISRPKAIKISVAKTQHKVAKNFCVCFFGVASNCWQLQKFVRRNGIRRFTFLSWNWQGGPLRFSTISKYKLNCKARLLFVKEKKNAIDASMHGINSSCFGKFIRKYVFIFWKAGCYTDFKRTSLTNVLFFRIYISFSDRCFVNCKHELKIQKSIFFDKSEIGTQLL